MRAGQNSNYHQQVSAVTPQERRQKHQWINAYHEKLRKERQCQSAAAINELETGECNEQETQNNRY